MVKREVPDSPGEIATELLAGSIESAISVIRKCLRNAFSSTIQESELSLIRRKATEIGDIYPADNWLRYSASVLSAALDNAAALPGILRIASPTVPAYAVGRSLLESCAEAYYLLEPGLDPVERLRRGMNQAITGLFEMARFVAELQASVLRGSSLDRGSGPHIDEELSNVTWLLDWAPLAGCEIRKGKRAEEPPMIVSPGAARDASTMARVDAVLAGTRDEHVPGVGHAYYRIASAVAHSAWHARAVLQQEPDQLPSKYFDAPSADSIALIVPVGVGALCVSVRAALTVCGRSASGALSVIEDLESTARETLQ